MLKKYFRRCRGSNPGHPRDRREYLPLYYNDLVFRQKQNILNNIIGCHEHQILFLIVQTSKWGIV